MEWVVGILGVVVLILTFFKIPQTIVYHLFYYDNEHVVSDEKAELGLFMVSAIGYLLAAVLILIAVT